MNSKRIVMCVFALMLLMLASPSAFADRQDQDMADRVYERFKEREQEKREQKRSRSEGTARRSESRNDRSRDSRSGDQRKSRDVQRSTTQRSGSSARTSNNERGSGSDVDFRSSARDERSSRMVGEQLSRELSDFLSRRSQRQTTSEPRTSNRSSRDRSDRVVSDSGDRDAREKVSLDQAVNIVRRQSGGKVISARSEGSGSTRKHRIKVLIDGRRVRTYVVSATTGRVY